MNNKHIINVMEEEFIPYAGEILTNNLPSVADGLLPVHRKVLWGLYKNKITHDKSFIKLLRAGAYSMVYYVFGDMPLYKAMKNMGNNSLNNLYLQPKGSFGDKRKKDGVGASPRYIECKLSEYSESLLNNISKNNIPFKRNFDNTEYEPIILPSIIPNILTNTSQSIAVGEASKIPAHNLNEVCDSFISYIQNENIDNSINILKCPDFSLGGQIIYDKELFKKIYKTGKGSFSILGKYRYDEKDNKIVIYEVPYESYIEDIEKKIIDCYEKGMLKEIVDIHNASDKDGIALEIYLKKHTNIKSFIAKLRKNTPFESKFACNFTILDLDNKTPVLMSLEDIIRRWVLHRENCIIKECEFDISEKQKILNKSYGLKLLSNDLDKAIEIIRTSKKEKIALQNLIEYFKLNQDQAEYISTIRLVNINEEWIFNKIKSIDILENEIKKLNEFKNDKRLINNLIISQLQDVKKKYGQPRKTEIIYEDNLEDITKVDLIEDYTCTVVYTQNYIKKVRRNSENHKLKDGEFILGEITTMNKSNLLIFTNKANRYKLNTYDLEDLKPSNLGQYIPNLIELEENEEIIRIVSVEDEKQGYIVSVYENGKANKTPITQFISNFTKIINCYNTDSKLLDIDYIKSDSDILFLSAEGKSLITNTSNISAKASKISMGVQGIDLGENENNKCIGCIINVTPEYKFEVHTKKGKIKEFMLDDVAPTGKTNEERSLFKYLYGRRNNKGNFVIKTRTNEDEIIKFKVNK